MIQCYMTMARRETLLEIKEILDPRITKTKMFSWEEVRHLLQTQKEDLKNRLNIMLDKRDDD